MDRARLAELWPHAETSRFVDVRPHGWHLQEMGSGETLLLIHGAGGATQSWRALMPELARTHRVVAFDMPGQGFTRMGARMRCGLDPLAEDIAALLAAERIAPAALIGHSAGAAVALRMWEIGAAPGATVIGINPALAKFEGVAGWLFPAMAKMLAINPFAAGFLAATASEASVRRLIEGTGSRLDPLGISLYRRLSSDPAHVDATITMMAQWRLDGLIDRLPGLAAPTTFLVAEKDAAVPPEVAKRAAERMPRARVRSLGALGHLAHEEDAPAVAAAIREALADPPPGAGEA
jgi:magnesium chelatase accessory protein